MIGPLQSNCYLLADEASGQAAVIDPGMESGEVLEAVRRQRLRLGSVIVTHGHFDHVFSSALFKAETGAGIVMHPDDLPLLAEVPETARFFGVKARLPPQPDRLVREGDTIAVGGLSVRVLETPGHTPGSISLSLGRRGLRRGRTLRGLGGPHRSAGRVAGRPAAFDPR